MKRNLIAGSAVCYILMLVLACSVLASEPVILKLWTIPDTSSPGADAKAARLVMDAFIEQHPEVVLRKTAGISIPQIGGSAAILMSIAGGVAPDVLECSQDDLANFIDQDFLLPLDEYLKAMSPEALADRGPPQLWAAARQRGRDGKVHTYALPRGYAVSTLKIRHDLATKLGYPQEKLPKTWDQLYDMAQAVADPDGGRYGVGLPKGAALATVFNTLLVGAGGQSMRAEQDGKLYATFDSDEGVLALDFLWRLMRAPWERNGKRYEGVAYTDVDLWTPFKRGKFIIGFSSMGDRGLLRAADKDRFLLCPLPDAPNGKAIPSLEAEFVGIYAGQKDERVRRVAFDYLWFTESLEARRLTTQTLVSEDAWGSANPIHLDRFGFADALARFPVGYLAMYKKALQKGQLRQTGRGASEIIRAMNDPVQRILVEDLDQLSDQARHARLREMLRESVAQTNARLHGTLTAAQLRWRKAVAGVVAIAIFVGFAVLFRTVHRAYAPSVTAHAEPERTGMSPQTLLKVSLILLPALALVSLWEYYPLIRGTIIAFEDYRFLGGTRFVGLQNFINVIFAPFFWEAMGRTLIYVALSIGLGFFAPIFLAILLHELPRGKVFFRVLYYLPALTTGIVVIFLWKTFFDPSPKGYLNSLFGIFHLPPQKWLEDPSIAMLCCVLPTVWAGVGPGSLIYLAALKSIPEDLYEAASVDGCGFGGKLWNVALPYMKPLIIMNFIGVFIGTFQSSGYILILTGGGPSNSTLVASLEIFYEAYARLSFGMATAMSWILAFSLIGFTLFQVKYLSKVEFRSASAR